MDGTDSNGNDNGVSFAYDLLLDILCRLPRRALGESRRVCRAWRAVVDGHNLLLPHSFPRGDKNYDDPYVCNPATVRCARLPPPPSEDPWPWLHLGTNAMFLAFDPAVSCHYEVFLFPKGTIQPHVQEKIQPRRKVRNIQPQTWIELDVEQLHLHILFEEEQLSEQGQEEIDVKVHPGYVRQSHTSPPSGLDATAEELPVPSEQDEVLPPEIQQEIHADVQEPNDKVVSIMVFSSQTGQWTSREFVPGRSAPRHLYDTVTMPHPYHVKIWKVAEYWRGSLHTLLEQYYYDPIQL
ncbi:hypothetical protein ACQ4PT_018044 [Festuca glaucescens]